MTGGPARSTEYGGVTTTVGGNPRRQPALGNGQKAGAAGAAKAPVGAEDHIHGDRINELAKVQSTERGGSIPKATMGQEMSLGNS